MKRAPQEIVGCQYFSAVECKPCKFYPDCLNAAEETIRSLETELGRIIARKTARLT